MSGVVSCWVGLVELGCPSWVVVFWVGLFLVGAKGEVSTAAAHASGRPPSVFLASPPSKACAMRSPTSSEHACPTSSLLCGRLLVALVESVLRPGGWESMCRLMCHCVCHVSLDNKYGRSVKAIHSSRSRWRDGTESVPAHRKSRRQEELDGERESPKVLREVSEVRHDAVSPPQV